MSETQHEPSAMADMPRIQAMRRFWARMAAIYGHRWTSAFGERCDDDSGALTIPGDTWQRGLSGIGEHRIGAGLNACVISADPWPPSLPAFRGMCMGIPSLFSVTAMIQGRAPRSPFAFVVWDRLDVHRLRSVDADKAERMIRDGYEAARDFVMAGGELPELPQKAIEKQEKPKHHCASSQTAEENLAKIAAMLHADQEEAS